jgi:hypothetical protein
VPADSTVRFAHWLVIQPSDSLHMEGVGLAVRL